MIAVILVLVVVLSQTIKTAVHAFKHGFDIRILTSDGGFPSTHCALVTALTFIVYFEQGLSVLFFAVLVFSLLVVNDSVKVRRETGEEAKLLNILVRKEHIAGKKLSEHEGHSPAQAFAGIILGFLITLLFYI
ncbi:divergent PAP2 family protein [Candidatus Woesearchaeota archaeon]|nr:MAG: divergent PAP2 family protein [Candidatus Woesearchaeota archaeon]